VSAQAKLPLPSRLMALQYRFFDRVRHRRANEAAGQHGTAQDFEALRGARQCVVVSFMRSGEPVPTAVNFGLSDDGKLYFRSEPHTAKIKRIRRNPHVRVWPSNMRGKPLGPAAEGRARILSESESEHAYRVLSSNWRADMRVLERGLDRVDLPAVYVEVVPAGQSEVERG
jgi:uncharacterized protein